MKCIVFFTVIAFFASCANPRKLSGTYHSNFAVALYASTKIYLHNDSVFSYKYRGHMVSQEGKGVYRLVDRYLVLDAIPFDRDSAIGQVKNNVINVRLNYPPLIPARFYLTNNKLYPVDDSGRVKKRAFGLSRHKRFLFFGSRYLRNREYFLKKAD